MVNEAYKELEIIRRAQVSTAHMPLEQNKRLCDKLLFESDSIWIGCDGDTFEITRTSAGFLVRILCPLDRRDIAVLVEQVGNPGMWRSLLSGEHQLNEVLIDADAPVYPQYETYEWS